MNSPTPVSAPGHFWLGIKKYLNRNQSLLSIVRAIRAIWLLGPWRKLLVRYHQRFNQNDPLPRTHKSLFHELDVDATVSLLQSNGYSPGIHLPGSQIAEILQFSKASNKRKHRNLHLSYEPVRQIAHDQKIIEVVSRYLGAEPVLYQSDLYWTYPITEEEKYQRLISKKSRFHYDVGDFRSLVVFIYLTDVTAECGPHVVIEATHQKKSARNLLSRFLTDQTAEQKYGDRIRTITGKPGTGFFEDLTCYHKHSAGKKERLMLTITYMLQRTPLQ
jgi:hypothetical protein